MKILFLLIPALLLGEVTSEELFKCHQSDYSECYRVGMKYASKYSPDFNPNRAESPLKKACDFGGIRNSCVALWQFYGQIKDSSGKDCYIEKACKLGDSLSCSMMNSKRSY